MHKTIYRHIQYIRYISVNKETNNYKRNTFIFVLDFNRSSDPVWDEPDLDLTIQYGKKMEPTFQRKKYTTRGTWSEFKVLQKQRIRIQIRDFSKDGSGYKSFLLNTGSDFSQINRIRIPNPGPYKRCVNINTRKSIVFYMYRTNIRVLLYTPCINSNITD